MGSPLSAFSKPVERWFSGSFQAPTPAQTQGWASILEGRSTLLLAPTGSGKTLAAFLAAIDKLVTAPEPPADQRLSVLYISPLKALGVDVERNLSAPLAGIVATAERIGEKVRRLSVAVRSGDTPQAERARILAHPPDILITTPESLYLLLTSRARSILASVDTVIVDEIHSMVSTKRGTHLFLSLERLEALRAGKKPLQRIGLSATQRPLEEVARLLGGGEVDESGSWKPRPVSIVDAGARRALDLLIEVPVEDMARFGEVPEELPSGPATRGPKLPSIWPSIHPRLVELIRAHRSTMLFVNSRRLAERLAGALNELAGQELALAHHGSISKEARQQIEDRLKRGDLPAIVATSSLELGIDMGAVDLVIQVEAPPSIAAGLQRIGRANHQVGAMPKGIIFPKFRGDLVAAAAAGRRMLDGAVEETFYPRNPLDVLAQQMVAMVAAEPLSADELYALVRRASPFADLARGSFEGVLDMLSGRYPSDEFIDLRPRITWDRISGKLEARSGARRIAVTSGGTIPDRGLYGVFLAGDEAKKSRRVGELDEEMVFESRVGDIFLLGASSWRIEDITHDRVLVSPAPGEPGRMPFWRGDRPGRPPELGRAIGELVRTLRGLPQKEAERRLAEDHRLEPKAAKNLLAYLSEQSEITEEPPSDRNIVLERFVDEVGDWRVCLLSPYGARVHAPWGMAIMARLRQETEAEIDLTWSDDGIIFRLPEADEPPDPALFFPASDEVEELVIKELAETSLFAARFRENAGRALLFPKRNPAIRMPLWQLRRRSANLLRVASQFSSFPIVLETYRECLRDVFDLPALTSILKEVESRRIRMTPAVTRRPSPFAAALLFNYVANFMYDGDAPLAERRAQALSLDYGELRQLLGEAELRKLLDKEVIEAVEARLQRKSGRLAKHADGVHDLLLSLGDLSRDELAERVEPEAPLASFLEELLFRRRIVEVRVGGELRLLAAEDMGRYRDALGIVPPPGLPLAFLEPVSDPLGFIVARWARGHAPFTVDRLATRLGLGVGPLRTTLQALVTAGKLVEGEFLPGGHGSELVEVEVLKQLKRQSLAKMRREVEPVEPAALGRFLPAWQGLTRPRSGLDALLSVIEQLQGAPLPASVLESEVLPARIRGYAPAMLDELCAAGEVLWRGFGPIGSNDARVALYLTDHLPRLAPLAVPVEGELAAKLRSFLQARGALFFTDLLAMAKGFGQDLLSTVWAMVFAGELTNDTLAPLRSMFRGPEANRQRGRAFRSRRALVLPGSEGRWSLLPTLDPPLGETAQRAAWTEQLLERYGVLTREAVESEGLPGGYSAIYGVLRAMEEAGKLRRGYFVEGLGATQFAQKGAEERLRAVREASEESPLLVLAATDPANPYGAALPWPEREGKRLERAAGAQVVLHEGRLLAFLGRTQRTLLSFLPESEPERSQKLGLLAGALAKQVEQSGRRALLISEIDGADPAQSPLARALVERGFRPQSRGYLLRRSSPTHG
ncbi:MAG: DEAD/DEAH box helicase [Myxococcota bacterium]